MKHGTEPLRQDAGQIEIEAASEATRSASRSVVRTLALAAVVACVLALLFQAIRPPNMDQARRSTLSARADAFKGLVEVSRRLGLEASRHARSYAQLPEPGSSVLVILDPLPSWLLTVSGEARLDRAQVRALDEWIERGGRIVATLRGRTLLSGLLGMRFAPGERDGIVSPKGGMGPVAEDATHAAAGGTVPGTTWAPPGGLLEGQGILDGHTDEWPDPPERAEVLLAPYLEREHRPAGDPDDFDFLPLGGEGPVGIQAFSSSVPSAFEPILTLAGRPIALELERGNGRLYVISTAYPFTNLALARGSTAYSVAVFLHAVSDGGQRRLVFDEYCHGLVSRRGLLGWITGTTLLYPVAASTLLILIIAWRNAFLLGSPREPRTVPRRAKEEFVMSLGDMALRGGRHRAAARYILDTHRARLRGSLLVADESAGRTEHPEVAQLYERVAAARRFGEEDLRSVAKRADEIFAEIRGLPAEASNARR